LATCLRDPISKRRAIHFKLIAAKLNIANGADDPAPVPSTITHADIVLGGFNGKLPYKVKTSSANGQAMVDDAATLESYNNGLLTPGCGGQITGVLGGRVTGRARTPVRAAAFPNAAGPPNRCANV
jgi:hypothetical protein